MAFNLGAFAGGLAKGGMDTYQTLEAIESQKKRDALIELQTKEAEQAMKGREALRSAISEQGDMNTANPAQMMAGPAPQGLPQEGGYMTPEVAASEKLARVRQRAIEGGADPTAVMQYANTQRADTAAFNEDKAFEWMRGIDKTVATKGLAKAAEEHLFPEYNKNQGLLNDGLTMHMRKDKQLVDFKDKDGKVVDTQPLNLQTFAFARDKVGTAMLASSGASNFFKTQELGMKREELGIKRDDVKSSGEYRRAMAGKANQSQVQVMNEKITSLGAVYRRADPSLSVEAAEKKAAQELVRSPEARSELVTAADVNKFLENNASDPSMMVKGKSGKMEPRPLEERIGIARRALGGGAAAAPLSKTDQAFAVTGDPYADKGKKPKTDEKTSQAPVAAIPPNAPSRNLYLEQMAAAEASRKARLAERMRMDEAAEADAALADQTAARNRAAIGDNFKLLYGGTR